MTLGDDIFQLPLRAGSYFLNNFFRLSILLDQLFSGLSPTFPYFFHLAIDFFKQCDAISTALYLTFIEQMITFYVKQTFKCCHFSVLLSDSL